MARWRDTKEKIVKEIAVDFRKGVNPNDYQLEPGDVICFEYGEFSLYNDANCRIDHVISSFSWNSLWLVIREWSSIGSYYIYEVGLSAERTRHKWGILHGHELEGIKVRIIPLDKIKKMG